MTADAPVKGIMLAERPKASTTAPPAFIPASGSEAMQPWGLSPVKKVMVSEVMEKPPGVNTKHKKWVKQLDQTLAVHREAQERQAAAAKEKEESLRDFTSKLRSAILSGEEVSFWKHSTTAKLETREAPSASTRAQEVAGTASPAPPVPTDEDIKAFVDSVYREAVVAVSPTQPTTSQTATSTAASPAAGAKAEDGKLARPDTASKAAKSASKAPHKPAWALSTAEVEVIESAEEAELLDFAQGLDFETAMDRLNDEEMQAALLALQDAEDAQKVGDDKAWRKNFVRAMNHVALKRAQDAAAAARARADRGDTASVAGESDGHASNVTRSTLASKLKQEAGAARAAALAGREADKGWDSSTKAGDDVGRMGTSLNEAEDFLRENPDMKGVHSATSVRAMLTSSRGQPAWQAGAAATTAGGDAA